MKANTLTQIALIAGIATAATAIYVGVSADPEPQIIREVVYVPAPTTSSTSTTTTSTTTTTTTTLPPVTKPAKSQLVRKVDEYAPGSSEKYGAASIEAGGKMACRMWNNGPSIPRMAVMREIATVMRLLPEELTVAAAISQAVLWTICPQTATFPDGPLPFDNWR
jgi:hypothetical protein